MIDKEILTGDMPGDRICIEEDHVKKAEGIFPRLCEMVSELPVGSSLPNEVGEKKVVVSVYGGSGVGKSEIASLLSSYFQRKGIESYILSGDNYPYRIPCQNDSERLRVFRESGREGLADYLGTDKEIDFQRVNHIIKEFKDGKHNVQMKRMGRNEDEIWYEEVDVSGTQILIVEWTHGNNKRLEGVDIPIFLNSTPEETLAHRKNRNRDDQTDSPFTTMVLEIEQDILKKQINRAKLIVSKSGEVLSYKEYQEGCVSYD